MRPCLGHLYTTPHDLSGEIRNNQDCDFLHLTQWISNGHWAGILRAQWTHDRRTGHIEWDAGNTTIGGGCESDQTLSSRREESLPTSPPPHFHTGSMNDMFNDQIHDMLQLGKSNLLTLGVFDRAEIQYLACWKRWGQYCSCLNTSPWLSTTIRGLCEPLIDF